MANAFKELDVVWVRLKQSEGWAAAKLAEVVAAGASGTHRVSLEGTEHELPSACVEHACMTARSVF